MNTQWQTETIPPSPLRTVLAYALFGVLWILFTALLVAHFAPAAQFETVAIAKGLLFIVVTALAPGLLLRPLRFPADR